MPTTTEQLFEDYAYYRLHTRHYQEQIRTRPMRSLKKSPDRLEQLSKLLAFCEEHDVDARAFLHSRFQTYRWNFAPPWHHLVPGSKATTKKSLDQYNALREAPLYAKRIQQNQQNIIADTTFDPNRDINPSIETVKRRYLATGDVARCVSESQTLTLGYHPKSTVCARCSAQSECEAQLRASVPFDIVALRRGDLSADQAKRLAGWYASC